MGEKHTRRIITMSKQKKRKKKQQKERLPAKEHYKFDILLAIIIITIIIR